MVETASFREMATALYELGFSEQEMANAELLAHQLRRAGFSEASAQVSIERMRRRAAVLDQARRIIERGAACEALIRELTQHSPPRWLTIWVLARALVAARLQGKRHYG